MRCFLPVVGDISVRFEVGDLRSEIQIGPCQDDVAINVAVTGVELRARPFFNFRLERSKHPQEIFRHLVTRAKVLECRIVGETKDALGAIEHLKVNAGKFAWPYSSPWRERHIVGLSGEERLRSLPCLPIFVEMSAV
jgi:hypothetical protein